MDLSYVVVPFLSPQPKYLDYFVNQQCYRKEALNARENKYENDSSEITITYLHIVNFSSFSNVCFISLPIFLKQQREL